MRSEAENCLLTQPQMALRTVYLPNPRWRSELSTYPTPYGGLRWINEITSLEKSVGTKNKLDLKTNK